MGSNLTSNNPFGTIENSVFCDVSLLMSYYESGEKMRAYHHTAPANSLYAIVDGHY